MACQYRTDDVTFIAANTATRSSEVAKVAAEAIILYKEEGIRWSSPLFELCELYFSQIHSKDSSSPNSERKYLSNARKNIRAERMKDSEAWAAYLNNVTTSMINTLGITATRVSDPSPDVSQADAVPYPIDATYHLQVGKAVTNWIAQHRPPAYKLKLTPPGGGATVPVNPRDLNDNLLEWDRFDDEFAEVFDQAPDKRPYKLLEDSNWQRHTERHRRVGNKAALRKLGEIVYEEPACNLFEDLFDGQCRYADMLESFAIGSSDRLFSILAQDEREPQVHRRVVGVWKAPWEVDLRDLVNVYNKNRRDLSHQAVMAVHQLYAYMSFNNCKYGILSNYGSTYLLKRARHRDESQEKMILQSSPEFRFDGQGLASPIAAYLFIFIKVYKENGFFYSSVDGLAPKVQSFDFDTVPRSMQPFLNNQSGGFTEISPDKLKFAWSQGIASNIATVADGYVFEDGSANQEEIPAIFKIYDLTSPDTELQNQQELAIYNRLSTLQGGIIPHLHASGHVWDTLHVLILEPSGRSLRAREVLPHSIRKAAIDALHSIHNQGVKHGDPVLRNVLLDKDGRVRIIDFGLASEEDDPDVLMNEMRQFEVELDRIDWKF